MGRKKPAEVVLHPQRLAILRVLATRPRTTKQLADALPDIAQATLYRHMSMLLESGFVEVVEEQQVRGAVTRTYALAGSAVLSGADLAEATRDDHFRYFATFAAGLLGEYGAYLDGAEVDLERDGVGFREHVLQLTDHELRDLLAELRASIAARAAYPPSADRSARLLATITMPVGSAAAEGTP
ncbi:helix-turn-helix domain-containing protein [Lysobacter korlensis]|uniref:Helix-turn-helix domain-containing protein n=1 Tax=Lysobacter korlensis TaxID=553636 RepID=A0ABV6RP06_9GAMM